MVQYFSDRELGSKPRQSENIPSNAWGGICTEIKARINDGSFGMAYPEICPDSSAVIYGCNSADLGMAIKAEIPDIEWPLNPDELPPTLAVLDMIEFLCGIVSKPSAYQYHSYWNHDHLNFDQEAGKQDFLNKINLIFSRNGIAFELKDNAQIIRLAPEILRDDLMSSVFITGDSELNKLLDTARAKFLNPNFETRKESLEKLWDAWERLKTIENPDKDKKKESAIALIAKVSSKQGIINTVTDEAKSLTEIGNNFRIRHSEIGKIPIEDNELVDYLFHRMFATMFLLLKKSGRVIKQLVTNKDEDDDIIPF
jgi:hypothetical protein